MAVRLQDPSGAQVDAQWLAQQAINLLAKAQEQTEVDHAACVKYLDLLARVLLPKTGGEVGREEASRAIEAARAAAAADIQKQKR